MMELWTRQSAAVARLELRRYILARRWLGVYLLALFPILLFIPGALLGWGLRPLQMEQAYATVFQAYVLRFGIIVSCGVVFSQLFRGETLEKTLHFYLLAPVRREILAIGKYVAGWEYASVALPASLQRLIIVYYLQPLLPSQIRRGPFAIITDPPAVWLAVPLLLIFSAALVAVAAWRVRRLEVTYSAD